MLNETHKMRTAPDQSRYKLGLLLVTASAVIWSTAGLFTQVITADTWVLLFWRGFFGAIGILLVQVALRGRKTVAEFRNMGWPGWIFAIVSALGMLCFMFSLRITTVAHVSIIYATVPLVAAALAWLVIGERPTRRAISASLVALLGVTVMV
ncbi:MAG: DMT family transporter, partial [Sulfitobacter sp.]